MREVAIVRRRSDVLREQRAEAAAATPRWHDGPVRAALVLLAAAAATGLLSGILQELGRSRGVRLGDLLLTPAVGLLASLGPAGLLWAAWRASGRAPSWARIAAGAGVGAALALPILLLGSFVKPHDVALAVGGLATLGLGLNLLLGAGQAAAGRDRLAATCSRWRPSAPGRDGLLRVEATPDGLQPREPLGRLDFAVHAVYAATCAPLVAWLGGALLRETLGSRLLLEIAQAGSPLPLGPRHLFLMGLGSAFLALWLGLLLQASRRPSPGLNAQRRFWLTASGYVGGLVALPAWTVAGLAFFAG